MDTAVKFGSYSSAVEHHVRGFFQGHAASSSIFDSGPLLDVSPEFAVLVVEPGPRSELWTYVSMGAGVASAPRVEFIVSAPAADPAHVELLAMVTYYHSQNALGVCHTVPIGRPWVPGSALDHLLVSLPYPYGPKLEEMAYGRTSVRLLWLVPITAAERSFKSQHGCEALEALFDENQLEYWNAQRASVV